jgi:hypothetical protein
VFDIVLKPLYGWPSYRPFAFVNDMAMGNPLSLQIR